jgi:hypothetical protein
MTVIPSNLSALDKRALQDLAASLTQDIQKDSDCDFIKADRLARGQQPALFAEIAKRTVQADSTTALPNQESVPIPSTENIDAMMLPRDIDLRTFTAAWKANGGKATPLDHQSVFDAYSDAIQSQRNCSRDESDAAAATRCPNLAAMCNSTSAGRRLAASLPSTSTSASPAWSPKSGLSAASLRAKSLTPVANPFLPGGPALANAGDLQSSWDGVFPTPITERDRSIVKYILNLLSRVDPDAGSMDALSIPILQTKLDAPTVRESAQSESDSAPPAVVANTDDERRVAANYDALFPSPLSPSDRSTVRTLAEIHDHTGGKIGRAVAATLRRKLAA